MIEALVGKALSDPYPWQPVTPLTPPDWTAWDGDTDDVTDPPPPAT